MIIFPLLFSNAFRKLPSYQFTLFLLQQNNKRKMIKNIFFINNYGVLIATNSTSNNNVAFGGITPPAPFGPYAR